MFAPAELGVITLPCKATCVLCVSCVSIHCSMCLLAMCAVLHMFHLYGYVWLQWCVELSAAGLNLTLLLHCWWLCFLWEAAFCRFTTRLCISMYELKTLWRVVVMLQVHCIALHNQSTTLWASFSCPHNVLHSAVTGLLTLNLPHLSSKMKVSLVRREYNVCVDMCEQLCVVRLVTVSFVAALEVCCVLCQCAACRRVCASE